MIKRAFDLVVSIAGLLFSCPLILVATVAIWFQDRQSPFYFAPRVGQDGESFRLIKLRSMVVNADKLQVDSTSANDPRLTRVGKIVRAYKVDELPQLWNVFKGDMSMVGPRPNIKRETDLYTEVERRLLSVKPGITDISSIVFSDLGEILGNSKDPNLDYNQLVRPWKSRLGLLYIDHQSLLLDIRLAYMTAVAILSRQRAMEGIQVILDDLHADDKLKRVSLRQEPLQPYPPPGATEIVTQR